ncbi:RNA polymerase sigma factor [Rhizobium sp. XQZ8]|uniref:RNA polymerase sigma factor n=1 Tax=Rhizobium populisoli TaxID=2859785 RepID=UPI001C67EB13|nr:RNA polymerase sigma factor [Rhizobium populisoli]MBW6424655.1 RNA polymerase sigma factor [Rhizobium populisoli]
MSAELVQRACDGDRSAFGALVEAHYDFIHSVAWRWCGTPTDAEDTTQEVCIRLGKSIRTFRGQSAFRTWLYTLTLNVVRDHQRKLSRLRRNEDRIANDPIFFSHISQEEDDRGDWLWAAVRRLPDKQRDAVLLVHGEGLSHAAAAQILECSENTVSWHLHEARKKLKDLLKREAV